jgi:hypothetical protein
VIEPGREWQAEAVAEAADAEAWAHRKRVELAEASYCEGIRDFLRYQLSNGEQEPNPVIAAIMDRYHDSI